MANYAELLSHVSIFQHLEPVALDRLGARLKVVTFNKDALIVSHSDPCDSMFIIDQGRVKVVLYGDSGREVILSIFRPGEFFGEMSLLDGQPRSANVIAIERSQVLVLSRDDFVQHLQESPATALNILSE